MIGRDNTGPDPKAVLAVQRNTGRAAISFANGTDSTIIYSLNPINDGGIYDVVGLRRGNTLELWVDGVLQSTASVSGGISSGASLRIGGRNVGSGSPDDFNGTLDDVMIYDYALPASSLARDVAGPPGLALIIGGLAGAAYLRRKR